MASNNPFENAETEAFRKQLESSLENVTRRVERSDLLIKDIDKLRAKKRWFDSKEEPLEDMKEPVSQKTEEKRKGLAEFIQSKIGDSTKVKKMEKELTEKDNENQQLRQNSLTAAKQIENLERKLRDAQIAIREHEHQSDNFEGLNSTLVKDLLSKKEQLEKNERESFDLKAQINALEIQNQQLNAERENLNGFISKINKEREGATITLKEEAQYFKEEHDRLAAQYSQQEKEKQTLLKQNELLSNDLKLGEERYLALNNEFSSLFNAVEGLKNDKEEKEQKIGEMQFELNLKDIELEKVGRQLKNIELDAGVIAVNYELDSYSTPQRNKKNKALKSSYPIEIAEQKLSAEKQKELDSAARAAQKLNQEKTQLQIELAEKNEILSQQVAAAEAAALEKALYASQLETLRIENERLKEAYKAKAEANSSDDILNSPDIQKQLAIVETERLAMAASEAEKQQEAKKLLQIEAEKVRALAAEKEQLQIQLAQLEQERAERMKLEAERQEKAKREALKAAEAEKAKADEARAERLREEAAREEALKRQAEEANAAMQRRLEEENRLKALQAAIQHPVASPRSISSEPTPPASPSSSTERALKLQKLRAEKARAAQEASEATRKRLEEYKRNALKVAEAQGPQLAAATTALNTATPLPERAASAYLPSFGPSRAPAPSGIDFLKAEIQYYRKKQGS